MLMMLFSCYLVGIYISSRKASRSTPASLSGACFSKVPKLFGCILSDIILFVYLQNEGVLRHETLQLLLFLFPLQHMKRPTLQNKQVILLRTAFWARKVLRTFEKQAPGHKAHNCKMVY